MIFPIWDTPNTLFYAIFAVFAVSMGMFDYFEWMPMQYSKFFRGKGIPSRLAMIILYGLPVLFALVWGAGYLASANLAQWIVFGVVVAYFAKRTLESAFLHKYSGSVQPLTWVSIAFFYTFVAAMLIFLNGQTAPSVDVFFWLGLGLFLVGLGGNFYHHRLLSNLRQKDANYHLPRGGWFAYVACPHYFFELLAWLGIVLMSRHLFALLAFVGMLGYLVLRSIKTRAWYRARFAEYPPERKCMIPFMF
jgi:protein-S-isoprenylcysteine O-methyltransferase Ste14